MFFDSKVANYALYAALLAGIAVAVYFLVTKVFLKGDKYDEEEGFFGFFDKKNEDYDEMEEDEDYEDDEDDEEYDDDTEDEDDEE